MNPEIEKDKAPAADAKLHPNPELNLALIELEAARMAAIKQHDAMQMRKEQDYQEEWLMRQREKRKEVADLPNGSVIEARVEARKEVLDEVGKEIDEIEPEEEHGQHFRVLIKECLKNYRNGLARFRLLPYLEEEEKVIACADELNNLKLDYRDDLDELESLLGLVNISQPFFCWFQQLKRDFDDLYSMRCGRDVLLRQWLRSFLDRDEIREEAGDKAGEALQQKIEDCFAEQGLVVPASYKPGYKSPWLDSDLVVASAAVATAGDIAKKDDSTPKTEDQKSK